MSYNQSDLTNLQNAESETKAVNYGRKVGRAKCVFDPSATSSMRSIAAHGLGLTIPANCYITRAYYKVVTTFTSATDAATIALKAVSANDLVSAVAISNGGNPWDAGDLVATLVTTTLSTAIKTTADVEITATVATEALTAGKLILWVEWEYFGDV